jgi:hypothetical protein
MEMGAVPAMDRRFFQRGMLGIFGELGMLTPFAAACLLRLGFAGVDSFDIASAAAHGRVQQMADSPLPRVSSQQWRRAATSTGLTV